MPVDRTPNPYPEFHTAPSAADEPSERASATVPDEAWEVFALDEDTVEPEPEYGDFWGEVDDEEMI